jgi:hypothetical protein
MANDLLNLAGQFWEDHIFFVEPAEAHGRCLWACLVFACIAKQNGLDVQLVYWSVLNDRYWDHWAIKFDRNRVLDFTHAQINGKPGFLFGLGGYPRHYHTRRVYPASLFLDGDFEETQFSIPDGQFNKAFMHRVKVACSEYDQATGTRFGSFEWAWLLASAAVLGWRLLEMLT